MHDIDQPGLDQLRLRHRRSDAHDRLIGEEHAAFRHGVDIAGEAKTGKAVEQSFVEPVRASQPVDLFGREAKIFEKIQHLLEAGGDQKSPARREFADEKFEDRRLGLAMVQIGLDHVELIEVGEQGARQWIHPTSPPMCAIAGEVLPLEMFDRVQCALNRRAPVLLPRSRSGS